MAAALRDSRSPGIAPDPGAAGPSKELLPWPLFPMDMRIEELNGPPEKALFADPSDAGTRTGTCPEDGSFVCGTLSTIAESFRPEFWTTGGRINSRASVNGGGKTSEMPSDRMTTMWSQGKGGYAEESL